MKYDVIILGAGPAGLFAAESLSKRHFKILMIDKGRDIKERKCPIYRKDASCNLCKICDISFGVGGAGGLSDGKLNLHHKIGMDINELKIDKKKAYRLINYVDSVFQRYGADKTLYGTNKKEIKRWKRRTEKINETLKENNGKEGSVDIITPLQRHMGTDKIKEVIENFKKELEQRGVHFQLKTEIERIIKNKSSFHLISKNKVFEARYLLVCPGRGSSYWFREQAEKLGIKHKFGSIDVGVRVELLAKDYSEITDLIYDPKFHITTPTFKDKVRTFCTNPRGEVTCEQNESMILVNGHANKKAKTKNTNFALLYTIDLTKPQADTTEYGRHIARFVNFISGKKPIIQRLGDLKDGHRSTMESIKKNKVKPTLRGCNPGDLGMALTYRVIKNVLEALEILDDIVPGVAKDSTLLYAPEIKFYDTKYITSKDLETNLKGLFVAGDGVGKSRGIIGAAVTGLIVAEGIQKYLFSKFQKL